jgi:streptogramin lyase
MNLWTSLRSVFLRLGSRRGVSSRQRPRPEFEVLEGRLCPSANLLVDNFSGNDVLAFDGQTGAALGTFASGGGLQAPVGIALGPDGNVYVTGRDSNDVVRYNGRTGAFIDDYVLPGSGGLNGPHGLVFTPQGNLDLSSGFGASVLSYNATTGTFQRVLVPSGSGGLGFPHGITVGPDGNVYVGDRNNNSVLRYDGTTGNFLGALVAPGSGGLNITTDLVFGPDGNLYVNGFNNNAVLRYDGHTGAFLGVFASGGGLSGPQGLAFGPDGNLYVSSFSTNQILRYDGHTGAFLNVFAQGGGLNAPTYLVFLPADTTTTVATSGTPAVFGQPVTFTATVQPVTPDVNPLTGSVVFTIDGVAQPAVPVSGGHASLTTASLGVGSHTVSAAYSGDGNFTGSASAALAEVVNQAGTSTTLTASADRSEYGQAVVFTATVSASAPGAGTPSGTVTFTIDGTTHTTVALSAGRATLASSTLGVGRHTISAAYDGDANFNGSASSLLHETVTRAHTSTSLVSSHNPVEAGDQVTFTATVSSSTPGGAVPTGSVTFWIDGVGYVPVRLVNGVATLTVRFHTAGRHVIRVTYSGDHNFRASRSDRLIEEVTHRDHHHHCHHHHHHHHHHDGDHDRDD